MHLSDASVACAQLKEAFGGDKLKSGELKRLTTGHKNRQSLTTALSPRTSNGKVADESGFESANHWHPTLIYAVTRKICWYAPATPRNGSVVHRTAPHRAAPRRTGGHGREIMQTLTPIPVRRHLAKGGESAMVGLFNISAWCAAGLRVKLLLGWRRGGRADGAGRGVLVSILHPIEPKATGVPLSECCGMRSRGARLRSNPE